MIGYNMAQEEKQLLLKDLCARLPYGVKVQFYLPNYQTNSFDEKIGEVFEIGDRFTHVHCDGIDYLPKTSRVKPYLRPMSSMTEEERIEFTKLFYKWHDDELFDYIEEGAEFSIWKHKGISPVVFDWLNARHFDYRGLIPMELALEAKEGMYELS